MVALLKNSKCARLRQILSTLLIALFLVTILAPLSAWAQSNVRPPSSAVNTGTGPELQDGNVPGGSMGTTSDTEMWRYIRKGIVGNVSIEDKMAGTLVQSEGENFRALRNGPLKTYGVWGLVGILGLLVLFFLIRGRIRIDSGKSVSTVTRFTNIERMGHWLLAVSFIVLAITGLNVTYGKYFLLPVMGKEAFTTVSIAGKWLHNFVAFAFMAGVLWIFLTWVRHNFPSRTDIMWILKGGGVLVKGVHPPAKKFNAGQKLIFWLVVLGGISISLSGISLLMPYEFPLFAKTFAILNNFGFDLPTVLTPIQEMQYASLWHTIVALVMICVVIAHIYIGSVGMEGAFDAMGSGEVDANWAKEHHSIWYEEEVAKSGDTTSSASSKPFFPAE